MDNIFDYLFCVISTLCSVEQKAQVVLWYATFKPITVVHHKFRHEYGVRSPDDKRIKRWYEQFRETGSVEKRHCAECPRRFQEGVDCVPRIWP
jgi:hypothetical protein